MLCAVVFAVVGVVVVGLAVVGALALVVGCGLVVVLVGAWLWLVPVDGLLEQEEPPRHTKFGEPGIG